MLVIIYTRLPEPGSCKTRLIPALGPVGAAELQRAMTEHCIERLRPGGCPLRIDHTGDLQAMRRWLGPELAYAPQAEGDLGTRLAHSFATAFAAGHQAACAIGCDVPEIEAAHLQAAEAALQHDDVVMGPATDGGYWLIGCSRSQPCLWSDMPWGGPRVAAITRQRCIDHGLSLHELPVLSDVDEPADLVIWQRVAQA